MQTRKFASLSIGAWWLKTAAASLVFTFFSMAATAQSPNLDQPAFKVSPVIPQQVRYTGALPSRGGTTVEAVFRIYADAEGGEPLWAETQRVSIDATGIYTILLGGASAQGLPQSVFAKGQARWLGVSVEQAPELERVLLTSVPYAMKSADAETLAGRAAADFVTQEQLATLAQETAAQPAGVTPQALAALTGSGTLNTVSLWTGASTLGNSEIVQGTSGIGINVASPATTLDVGGNTTLRGTAILPARSPATATTGENSYPLELSASSWSQTASAPVAQTFAWLAGPTGNDTSTPLGKLYLLFGSGANPILPTGLSIAGNGLISFASGQVFPGVGTITGVTASSPLTGGGTTGTVTVGLNAAQLETTLNSVYPRLSAANTFLGNQAITGGLSVSGVLTAANSTVTGLSSAAGGLLSNGNVILKQASAATATGGLNSPFLAVEASAYSSASSSAVPQNFAWLALPTGNNTSTPSGKLDLLFSSGASAPAPTGLSIASNGAITFSPSQTFPITGTGGGTITGITTTSPLTGSGTLGSVALGLNQAALVTAIAPSIATAVTPTLESSFNGVYAQLGASNTFTTGQTIEGATSITGTNLSGNMLSVSNSGDSFSAAINASNSGQYGSGIYASAGSDGYGIQSYGTQTAGSIGILGSLANSNGPSNSFFLLESDDGLDAGVWADGPNGQEAALIATADDLSGGIFFNDSAASSTILVLNNYSGGPLGNVAQGIGTVLRAGGPGGICGINQTGNISCTGQMKALVTSQDGVRQVETYTVQSAENWVEDYGSGQLNHGSATIALDPAFADTVNANVEFHVFLTPGDDCKGLYVTHKTAAGFEVHELGGGLASIPFDYKIVAKRRGLEQQRLVDVTARMKSESEAVRFKPLAHRLERSRRAGPGHSTSALKIPSAVNP